MLLPTEIDELQKSEFIDLGSILFIRGLTDSIMGRHLADTTLARKLFQNSIFMSTSLSSNVSMMMFILKVQTSGSVCLNSKTGYPTQRCFMCCTDSYNPDMRLIANPDKRSRESDGPPYDSSAHTECKLNPDKPLYYHGGILMDQEVQYAWVQGPKGNPVYSPTLAVLNLLPDTYYCFSSYDPVKFLLTLRVSICLFLFSFMLICNFWALTAWIKTNYTGISLIKAGLITETDAINCTGTVLAQSGCWSFLKGGFLLNSPSNSSLLYFQNSEGKNINVEIASPALQPFSKEQWRLNQKYKINKERKREVIIHISNTNGVKLEGADVTVTQESSDFPFGSAISANIIGNLPYQKWFTERFNAAVFENELKWYATEPTEGQINYTIADRMLEYIRSHQILARGHNIFWEDPRYTPPWVVNLTSSQLRSAVNSRIKSLMERYKEQFVHWDVSNELLHFDFYEQKLGPNASLEFFKTAHESDPLATLFLNDYNVVETCDDNSTVDAFVMKVKELRRGGVTMDGIGLEGHFHVPNLPMMRAVLDKLATLGLPIWLTEVDISRSLGQQKQALYLEEVLREGFSHPAVRGIMLWSALDPNGCYQMCLTDDKFNNLPAGDVVDKLLKEWQTGTINGQTDEQGSFIFQGFLGEYKVSARYGDKVVNSTFSLNKGDETRHFSIQL
ncbi:OLC1v1003463C1 [Oldenlandia corymbosa var. corymbosa]|uniref:OLC1v1003463C1 n=1 Tax=Oldenlandia corymbosa var. corymbosa TaxID=529605 RepID=A0AAV1DDH2_OLDCO|nr:OLC1v1003463C1 [Oldenlandia corymbosa var. corymbosa]